MHRALMIAPAALLTVGASLLLVACDDWPHDTRGTTRQVLREGVLHAGLSANPPWTHAPDGRPSGIEVDLVERFAAQLGVDVDWSVMSESELIDALDTGQIHVAVAGFRASAPFKSSAVRFTRAYVRYEGERHVLAVPSGESRLLVLLEEFLHERGESVRRELHDIEREPGS